MRRLEILVDAYAIVAVRRPDVRFEFVGDGTEPSDRRNLEDRVRAAGIDGVVTFTGQLPMAVAGPRQRRRSVSRPSA